jgi:hypothetical protein
MVTVQPHGAFKNGFDLVDGSGTTIASFSGSAWREGGEVRVGDQHWEFRRDRSRRFTLAGPSGVLASAERTSIWGGGWLLTAADRTYELARPSWRSRRYEVRADGRVLGELHPKGMFASRTDTTLPPDMPPPVQAFVVAVVLTIWRREQSAAASANAAH